VVLADVVSGEIVVLALVLAVVDWVVLAVVDCVVLALVVGGIEVSCSTIKDILATRQSSSSFTW
jgi:hypothetical protein